MNSREVLYIRLSYIMHKDDIILVQVNVDIITFGSTNDLLCEKSAKLMQGRYEMSMMEKLHHSLDYK